MKKSKKLTVSRKRQPSLAAAIGRRLAEGGVRVGREVEANFRAWFERNFVNCRAGRIGHASYSRAGALDDRPGDGLWYSEALGRAWADYNAPLTASEMGYITSHPLIAFQLAAGISDVRGLRSMIRGLTQRTNRLQQKAYRGKYYGRDNARRRMLAAERRKITRRTTTNPCPTPDAFRAAFARVKDSVEAKLLFGGMVHDLACYVDSCLRYDGSGNIVGRNGGIKEWLADNVPELYPRYKTIMRYKALAMRLRQAMGVKDPEPTSALLADLDEAQYGETPSKGGRRNDPRGGGETQAEPPHVAWRKGTVAGERNETSGCGRDEEAGGRNGESVGDENYYAHKSHHGRGGCYRGYAGGGEGKTDGVCGMGLERMRKRKKPAPQRAETVRKPSSSYCRTRLESRRREMARRLLAGCENTFKGVFGRVDAALGTSGWVDT